MGSSVRRLFCSSHDGIVLIEWNSCVDWFDVLDAENRPVLTEREILRNLQAIVSDADQMPIHEVRSRT